MSKPTYIYIVGPTGTGKTELSINVARDLNIPVLNADSLQVYKLLNIGTAKPTSTEMGEVPHYLFDYIMPPKSLTAADYLGDVVRTIDQHKISDLVFVGGSGFYIQALEKGLFPQAETPDNVKKEIQEWIDEKGFLDLYNWLQQEDPETAHIISENDHYRIKRAVEVMKTQNKKVSVLKKEMNQQNFSPLPDHKRIKVGLKMDKADLRKRIELRTQKMLDSGLIDEVQVLLDQGISSWPPLSSVGYKETQIFLRGEVSQNDLFELIVTSTMQLIKKQMTWFKRDKSIAWFDVSESDRAQDFVSSEFHK